MSGRATVYDVARLSGVSIKTVSRVVNGSTQVTAATREKVLAAVAELGYMRNPFAYSLRTGSSATVGVVVDSIGDNFFAALVSVVEERLLAQGFSVLVGSTGREPGREQGQVVRMLEQNVAGLLLVPNPADHAYLPAAAPELPVVLVDRGWELPGFDVVGVQDREGGRIATEQLLRHGHRRIAFLGGAVELSTVGDRLAGFRDAMAAAGCAVPDRWIRTDCGWTEGGVVAVHDLLADAEPPTALFSSNARASVGAVTALHRLGRTDVAVVSFGDFDLATAVSPAVTVVDQDPTPIAAAAADLLLARMSGDRSAPRRVVLPVPLVARGSGEITPRG
jgi:LacI family transcriptional regulator